MHLDLEKGAPGALRGSVAIVGAGAAGISAARRLLAGGLEVILIESGGLDYEPGTARLNDGEIQGMDYYPLKDARLRLFGGTTAIWGGRCAELDPIDLERRDWVPHSGWPISWAELQTYYGKARQVFGLPPRTSDGGRAQSRGNAMPPFDPTELKTPLWMFDNRFDRFRFDQCRDLFDHPRCTVVTHATVSDIVAFPSGEGIARLDVRSIDGRRMRVVADHYILAAGGIENPRLLLASRKLMPAGLGNDHDQVGRYFMEHPHARGGRIVNGDAWRLLAAFSKRTIDGVEVAPLLTPAPDLQRREGLLNTSLTIVGRRPVSSRESWGMRAYLHAKHRTNPDRRGRMIWMGTKRAVRAVQRYSEPLRPWLLHRMGRLDVALLVRAEQAPNPDSRVTLSDRRDAIGMPQAALDWQTSGQDVESVAGLVRALGRETRRLGLGQVEAAPWLDDPTQLWRTDPLISAHPLGGYHHMGTTRMSEDPRHGVTNAYGRVHGLDNLYVAGSSLFPTSGWANPTLTIVALALRTADEILRKATRSTVVARVCEQVE